MNPRIYRLLPPALYRSATTLLGFLVLAALPARSPGLDGPGFPQQAFTAGQLIGQWDISPAAVTRTTVIGYHRGWLFTDTRDLINTGGLQVWDISNLSNPVEVHQVNLRKPFHVFYFATESETYINSGTAAGPRLWDFSDMTNIIPSAVPWTVRESPQFRDAFPFPYYYLGQNGYSALRTPAQIWDARTDTLVASVDFLHTIFFKGVPLVIGNLMVVAGSNAGAGVATYDVGDPANPVLLDVLTTGLAPGYEPAVYGSWAVMAQTDGGDLVSFVDYSDPTDLQLVTTISPIPGNNRYAQFQDEFMFVGDAKIDLQTFSVVDTYAGGDEYLLPLGNLLFICDHTGDIQIYAHQAAPDTKGPYVNYHNPADGAVNQPLTSRIGVVIPETLNYQTINSSTFIVRPVGGAPISGTLTATDKDIINFTPDTSLLPDTTYNVILPANGIEDVSGNGIETTLAFQFSTGPTINQDPVVISITPSLCPVPVGSNVQLTATATNPDLAPFEFNFDFGDGSSTGWQASNVTGHAYAVEGHYDVVLQVRDNQGGITAKVLVVTVINAPTGPFGANSSQIVCDETNRRVYAVNPDNDTVTAIDADTLLKLWEVPTGARPRGVATANDGTLWVTCQGEDRIEILNAATGGPVAQIGFDHGAAPHGLVFSPGGGATAFCTLEGSGKIVKLDPVARSVTATLALGSKPRALAVSGDGARLWITRFISPATHGEVWEVDAASLTRTRTISLAIDPGPDTSESGRGVPNYLAGMAVSRDGQRVWIASKKDNIERGLFRDGLPLDPENSVRAITSLVDLTGNTEVLAERIDFDNTSQLTAVAFSPLGDYAFVTSQGKNEIVIADTFTGEHIGRIPVGLAPQGICFDSVTNRLFTKDFMSRTVTAVEAGDFLQTGDLNIPAAGVVSTVTTEKLWSQVLLGKQIFYNSSDERMSLDSYFSCAVCHDDGSQDGRVWDFTDRGEGLRNTTTLRAQGGTRNGPVHWTGNFDEIQDFELDIVNAFGGGGFIEDGVNGNNPHPSIGPPNAGRSSELDALAAYLDSLTDTRRSPHRNPDGSMTADAVAGMTVFQQANCASCHVDEIFTDSALDVRHDVGTITAGSGQRLGQPLDGFDTPTLLGLWETGPWLHDGSAATFYDVIDNPGHGNAAALPQADKDKLVAYLLQLERHEDLVPTLARWRYNGSPADAIGNLDAVLIDGAGFVTDARELTHALSLDGVSQFAAVAGDVLGDALNARTFSLWFKANDPGAAGFQELFDAGGLYNGFAVRLNSGALEAAVRRKPGVEPAEQRTLSVPFSSTDWNHVAVVFDGTGGGVFKLFLNAQSILSADPAWTVIPTHGDEWGIGARNDDDAFGIDGANDAGSDFFDGNIDDVRIFPDALSGPMILDLVLALDDSDNDQLPDAWERTVAGDLASLGGDGPGPDTDGDGRADASEHAAGTNPLDADDNLRIVSSQDTGADFILDWTTKAGKAYELWWSQDLLNWSQVSSHAGTGGVISASVSKATLGNPAKALFRVSTGN